MHRPFVPVVDELPEQQSGGGPQGQQCAQADGGEVLQIGWLRRRLRRFGRFPVGLGKALLIGYQLGKPRRFPGCRACPGGLFRIIAADGFIDPGDDLLTV